MIFILISLGCVIPEAVRERPLLVAIFRHYTDIEAHHELMYPHHYKHANLHQIQSSEVVAKCINKGNNLWCLDSGTVFISIAT